MVVVWSMVEPSIDEPLTISSPAIIVKAGLEPEIVTDPVISTVPSVIVVLPAEALSGVEPL